MPTVSYQIAQYRDDSEELESGVWSYTQGSVMLGNTTRWNMFRFVNVQIPQGARITSAFIKLTVKSAPLGTPPNIIIYGEKNGNSLMPSLADFTVSPEISGRNRTTSIGLWTSPGFSVINQQYSSPDIKAVIQEIVNQGTWRSNNAMAIIFDVGTGTSGNAGRVYSKENTPGQVAVLEITFTPLSTAENQPKRKRFLHKIYNGSTYVTTLMDDLVLNQPNYSWNINGGLGEMNIDLGLTLRQFQDDYEGQSIVFGYRVKTFVHGVDESTATQIYDGILSGYEPIVDENGNESIRVRVVSHVTTLERTVLKSGSDTTIAYSSVSPESIFQSLLDLFNGIVDYNSTSVDTSGTTVSYEFNFQSFLDGLNKTLQLCPSYWYYVVDQTSVIYLRSTNFEVPSHQLYIGKEVNNIKATKAIDDLINVVYFKGGGDPALYKKYTRTSSVTAFGTRELLLTDERVTSADTANTIATKILDEKDHPLTTLQATVMDNSIDSNRGYDIESLKPGDVVRVTDPQYETTVTLWDVANWDLDFWDYDVRFSLGLPMQIQRIDYKFDSATIYLVQQPDDVMKRMEDIKRNLQAVQSETVPSAPT